MYRTIKRQAFTLIELLTVMAIITILIGILTPALSTARSNARKTAIRAQINAMEVGMIAFSNDEGQYVPSNPVLYASDRINPDPEMNDWEVGDSAQPLQGAHLIVDALVGRDFLGYDPKAPPFGPGGTGGGGGQYDRWARQNDRRQPYMPVDGVDVTSDNKPPTDAFGDIPNILDVHPRITGAGTEEMLCRVFRDKFGWPILYYRASPSANQNTPIISTIGGLLVGDGVYEGLDNRYFTSYAGPPPPPTHKIEDADQPLSLPINPLPTLENRFAEFIRSLRATKYYNLNPADIEHPRPVKFSRFIILSAGKDGIYGNLDDISNFEVFSQER